MQGTVYQTERIDRHDADTGLFIRQVTSFPTISLHLHYETPTFTPDAKMMLVVSQRTPARGAPYDLLAMGADGMNPTQINGDNAEGASSACLTVDGKYALYLEGTTAHRTSLDGKDDVEIGRIDGATGHGYYRGMRSYDGRYYFAMVRRRGRILLVRWDLKTGEHVIAVETDGINHPRANPGGPEIQFGAKYDNPEADKARRPGMKDCIHCETLESIDVVFPKGPHGTAHSSWLGRTGRYHGTLKPPGRAVVVMDRDAPEPVVVTEGPYFWHSGASEDGEWIVADTNWPDEGLWLINVATGRRERLCWPGASQGHPQFTHCHANLSEHAEYAVYTSDRTGATQVYVVTIPEDLRARLRSG